MLGTIKWGFFAALWVSTPVFAAPYAATPLEVFQQNARLGSTWSSHEYIITAKPTLTLEMETAIQGTPCWIKRSLRGGLIRVVACPSNRTDAHWIETLSSFPSAYWVDANYKAQLEATPNDLSPQQWHIENTGQKIKNQWGTEGADMSVLPVWERQVGTEDIVVAVPDTGVWLNHEDLQTNIWTHPGEICLNGLDDDGNGYVDDCNGWDFGDNDFDVSPMNIQESSDCPKGHGTFIAGLIGADTYSDNGIAGLNWNVRIMPLKIVADTGCELTAAMLTEAIHYAVDNNVNIISTSFKFFEYVVSIEDAFAAAQDAGVIVTIAAGNDGLSNEDTTTFPIDFGHTGTLTIGASDNQDNIVDFSNWGREVDLFAPGHNVYSLGLNNTGHIYHGSGTSYAAPLAAGTAALLLSEYPSLTARQVTHAIRRGSDLKEDWDCLTHEKCSATPGRLNAEGSLLQADAMMEGAYLTLGELRVEDKVGEAPGDSDGILERGEVAYVFVGAENLGSKSSGSLRATITMTHPNLLMSSQISEYGSVASASTGYPSSGLKVSLSKECTEDSYAYIGVQFEDQNTGEVWHDSSWIILNCYVDDDGDGHLYPDDCDDENNEIHPDQTEACNLIDDNCDGDIDGLGAAGSIILFEDLDGDGFGSPALSVAGCEGTPGWASTNTDCDDSNPQIYPDATEYCDDLDNDCNAIIDDQVVDPAKWYMDRDGDGLGDPSLVTLDCKQPKGHVSNANDCDDLSTESCEKGGSCQSIGALSMNWWVMCIPALWRRRRSKTQKVFQIPDHRCSIMEPAPTYAD